MLELSNLKQTRNPILEIMNFVLTLVASSNGAKLENKHFDQLSKILQHEGIARTSDTIWLSEKKAAEHTITANLETGLMEQLRETLAIDQIDCFITPNKNRKKKLLLADMDSTIVEGETLDDLAGYAGIKDQIAEITARAMNGELDFEGAIKKRVGLLKDLPQSTLNEALDNTKLNPGAKTLVKTMKKAGATCILVSGGFTHFTQAIAEQCNFDYNHGNILDIQSNKLTGNVIEPILDKHAKVSYLKEYTEQLNLNAMECFAVGDGANDLPMLKIAGTGIGYHPKDTVKSAIQNSILYGDLTTCLYIQGYSDEYIKT